jgi:hypothetical protein
VLTPAVCGSVLLAILAAQQHQLRVRCIQTLVAERPPTMTCVMGKPYGQGCVSRVDMSMYEGKTLSQTRMNLLGTAHSYECSPPLYTRPKLLQGQNLESGSCKSRQSSRSAKARNNSQNEAKSRLQCAGPVQLCIICRGTTVQL